MSAIPLSPSPHVTLLDLHHRHTSEQRAAAERAAAATKERQQAAATAAAAAAAEEPPSDGEAHMTVKQHMLAVVSTALHAIIGSPAPSPKTTDASIGGFSGEGAAEGADGVSRLAMADDPSIPLPPGWAAARAALHSLTPERRCLPDLRIDTNDTRALRRGLYAACACMYLPQVVGWSPDAAVASSKPEVKHPAQDATTGTELAAIEAVTPALEPLMQLRVPSTFEVSVVTGGITNQLYRCALATHPDQPVLVRIYGPRTELVIDRSKENEVVDVLSATGQGPRIYGRFENGRLESWLRGSSTTPAQMREAHLSGLIAGALARLHVQDMPFARDAVIHDVLHKWNRLAADVAFPEDAKKQAQLDELNFPQIVAATEEYLGALAASPFGALTPDRLVFAHCDLLSGNIMFDSEDAHDTVSLVDFEYANFNPRGFDFANHFCECSGFDCDWSVFPSASAQLWFLRNYLSTRRVVALGDVSMREAHALYAETQCWLLAPHLFWAAWAVVQARHSPIEFDYLAYAKQRWEGYLTMKDRAHEWIKKTTEEVDAMETIR